MRALHSAWVTFSFQARLVGKCQVVRLLPAPPRNNKCSPPTKWINGLRNRNSLRKRENTLKLSQIKPLVRNHLSRHAVGYIRHAAICDFFFLRRGMSFKWNGGIVWCGLFFVVSIKLAKCFSIEAVRGEIGPIHPWSTHR